MLLFLLLIFKGCSQKYNTIWKNDFKKVLFSMMGPEWADLRLKLVTEITLTNQENYHDDVECPVQLLNVLKTLNCKNTASNMEEKLLNHQFFSAFSHDPVVLNSLIQRNCSKMPNKYVDICHVWHTKKHPPINILELISDIGKCYEEHKRATIISLSFR